MKINYLAKANTTVTAKTRINIEEWPDAGSKTVLVEVFDSNKSLVVSAEIEMYISKKS